MPEDPLQLTLILLATAVLVIGVFRHFHLSSVLGYLVVGVLLGPATLGWLPDTAHTQLLAELGVVFLLFTVGLEFSLPMLLASRRIVLGLGGAQVALTSLLCGVAAWIFGLSLPAAFVLGGAVAMSSTAIVMKQLREQMELSTRLGQLAVSILLFQDVASLPFLLLLPKLARGAEIFDSEVLLTLGKGGMVFMLVAVVGRRVVRPVFHWVATCRSPELFMLVVLLTVLGAATFAHIADLSPPLGAFLAGMVLGETEFRHQVEADIRPFREVLLGLFFTTIGMEVEPGILKTHLPVVLGLALAILLSKTLLIGLLARLFGEHPAVAACVGLTLSQAGEFGLLLISKGLSLSLVPVEQGQMLLAALFVSMAAAPVVIRHNAVLIKRLPSLHYQSRLKHIEEGVSAGSAELSGHVIIAGYGRVGQNLGFLLHTAQYPYIALDLDPERIETARAAGNPVVYGDATHEVLLHAAKIERAAALVVTFDHSEAALKILRNARYLNPDIAILVRTRDDAHLEALLDAGATEVLPEALESSLSMGAHLLRLLGVSGPDVEEQIAQVRTRHYELRRRFFHSQDHRQPRRLPGAS